MAFGTRVWSAGKFFSCSARSSATYIVFAAASMRVAIRAREVQVPDLTNRTPNEATAARQRARPHRAGRREPRRPDPKIAAGHVLGQDPPPG